MSTTNHPVQHPLPAGVHDTFTYSCNSCGGTISVVSSSRQPHTCTGPAECICTNECDEVPEQNPCSYCRALDIYDPCPVVGFGCGWSGDECDCCTPEQQQAARNVGPARCGHPEFPEQHEP